KKLIAVALAALTLVGCDNAADLASRNVSTAAANFEVNRRIVFINIRTGEYLLSVEGRCARENTSTEIEITCKTGPNQVKKHFMGLTTEVTYFIEQIDPAPADEYRYRVTFNPTQILPDVQVR
ncbi:beta-sandwich lipoprotein, partial [Herbiconiux daphne]